MHEQQQRINAVNELTQANMLNSQQQRQQLEQQLYDQQPITQTYPTGTTLTSIDGLPILKRKRGRPPKNRTIEVKTRFSTQKHFSKL